jgi:carbohydrate-selective porin OprB
MAVLSLRTMKVLLMQRNRTMRDSASVPTIIKMNLASLRASLTTAARAVRLFGHRARGCSSRAWMFGKSKGSPTFWRRAGTLPILIILSGNLAVHAADTAANQAGAAQSQSVPWLLGDWNGTRTQLQKLGIDFQFGYISELAYNATGGVRSTAAYTDQYTAGATLNLERLFGIQDATFQATFTERTGRHLGDDAGLGTLQLVQEVYGRGQTARLTQFWFDQKYLNGAIDWKIGRMTFGEDFAAFSCDFQNLTFAVLLQAISSATTFSTGP